MNFKKEILLKEIETELHDLAGNVPWCGTEFSTNIIKLSDGKLAQIKVSITLDADEFEEPCNSFV